MTSLEEVARGLLAEKYAHPTPEHVGGVDGPTRQYLLWDRQVDLEEAQAVVRWPSAVPGQESGFDMVRAESGGVPDARLA